MSDTFLPIREYEGLYEVNTSGVVRSISRMTPGKHGLKLSPGRTLKQSSIKGYPCVTFSKSNKAKSHMVHRLVAQTFIDNPNSHPAVNHINGVKTDNEATNLEWCTYSENMQHAYRTGLMEGIKTRKRRVL